jgi:hypothetical protein
VAWNAAEHPRYPNGKFRPKFSQSVRLSPISVSYNAGVRIPIVPGRANLYVGALARVERSGGNTFLKGHTDRAVNAIAGKFGDVGGRSNLSQLLKGNEINAKGYRVTASGLRPNTPTFRVSSTPHSRDTFAVREAANDRAPRRRARTRSARVPATVTTGVTTATPKALPKGRRPSRKGGKASTKGRRVRR